MQFNRNWPHQHIEIGPLRSVFWGEFRRPRWTGARLIQVHLHSNFFFFFLGGGGGGGGALKWPLKGASRLIEVAATAGLTVFTFLCSRIFVYLGAW